MNKRNTVCIDYKLLHSTGERAVISEPETSSNNTQTESESLLELSEMFNNIVLKDDASEPEKAAYVKQLGLNISILTDEIFDFIDENPINDDMNSIEDFDIIICKIEQLRTAYRTKIKEVESIVTVDENFTKDSVLVLEKMKGYIKNAKYAKNQIKRNVFAKTADEDQSKMKALEFQIKDIKIQLESTESKFMTDLSKVDNDDIIKEKNQLGELNKSVHRISSQLKELLLHSEKFGYDDVIDNIQKRYEKLVSSKNDFLKLLEYEHSSREIEKHGLFKESLLSIKVSKFKGYSSSTDVFTFQNNFEKLYLRNTPRSLLPDLLKNNYLEDQALSLVKNVEDIDEIWKRLKTAFGDANLMLSNKLTALNDMEVLWKLRNPSKIADGLSKIINLIKDVIKLSKEHGIEQKLYNGDGINKIFKLLGDSRTTRWLQATCESKELLQGEILWLRLIEFLEKYLKVQQQRVIISADSYTDVPKSKENAKDKRQHVQAHVSVNKPNAQGSNSQPSVTKSNAQVSNSSSHNVNKSISDNQCLICGKFDHVVSTGPQGVKFVQYFTCPVFAEMNPLERFLELRKKNLCFQCLYPGADVNSPKHKHGRCQKVFCCTHEDHDKYPRRKHVLVCHEHKDYNQQLLDDFKARCILRRTDVPDFSRNIKLSFFTNHDESKTVIKQEENSESGENAEKNTGTSFIESHERCEIVSENSIYLLQNIKVNEQEYCLFFDSGCGDFVCKHSAVQKLGANARQEVPGPIKIGGVGGVTAESQHGVFSVKLPLSSGHKALFTGVCLERITTTFPVYPLQGRVLGDIRKAYQEAGGNICNLPNVPKVVGGDVDMMIGIKYLRYHPERVFQLPSGLTIYKSMFTNSDGSRGVIGGPHRVFSEIEANFFQKGQFHAYLSDQFKVYQNGYKVNPDLSLLSVKCNKDVFENLLLDNNNHGENTPYKNVLSARNQRIFNEIEFAGSEISYRCSKCRNCKDCRHHEQIESVSIKEEMEQELINQSVTINVDQQITTASLPLLQNPSIALVPNKNKALQVYYQQVKKLNKCPQDKADVIASELKLHQLGHVAFVKDLTPAQQNYLKNHTIQNYIAWRAVWNGNSVSTPCRLVFDASQPTASGKSLNDILAKGKNNMNKLIEIFIRWSMHKVAIHTDIRKMYNTVKLREEDWCLQRYVWHNELDPNQPPEEKVILTLIYGVKASGNQSERGLRETARFSKVEYPEVHRIVENDIYVDDCLTGETSKEIASQRADEIELVLQKGGFSLKGVTMSHQKPSTTLSEDSESVKVAGMRWYPEQDEISLDVSPLNFAKKSRGKKPTHLNNTIPKLLTRRHCVSKVSEIFDLTGKITPITAALKIDLRELTNRKLDWDDVIPDNLRPIWDSNFQLIQEINQLKFNRAIVPDDAVNLEINTIDSGDASKSIVCVAIHARFLKKDGSYSCQLVFSRSRLVPEGMTQPRAELFAATVNAHTGEVVRRSFGKYWTDSIKLTDSQISLYWIHNDKKPLSQWVRNRVVEIRRFTDPDDWKYVKSADMIADVGTRKGASLNDVNRNSNWINGFHWMTEHKSKFPVKSVEEI